MQKMVQMFEVVLGGEDVALPLRLCRQVRALGEEDKLEVVWTFSLFLQLRII
jgi:hypothetical protein